ncbi:MAG TPA: nucleotide exchange factor GrpE [Solirubrobacteraceae bacterium]|nr:nucleotide exchange factor GrpE [Solirubrobacteraceae bacterium]
MQSSRETDDGERHSPLPAGQAERGAPAREPPERGSADGERGDASGAELAGELARAEDRYKRALADLDNYRKRTTREVDRRVAEARQSALEDWLQVLDSVERAIQLEREGPCYEGLRAVLAQIDSVLARQGAQRIGAPGDQFDPERHEAVAVRATSDLPDRTIVEVQRSGFAQGERVIRPAQVVVARAPEHAH